MDLDNSLFNFSVSNSLNRYDEGLQNIRRSGVASGNSVFDKVNQLRSSCHNRALSVSRSLFLANMPSKE
jgi:hypothetical protein